MSNKLIGLIIGAAITILISASVMIPIINDASYELSDKENNVTMYFTALKDYGGEVEITPTGSALIINGVENTTAFIASSNYYLQYYPHSNWYEFELHSMELGTISSIDSAIIHENGTISVTVDEVTQTTTISPSWTFIPDPDGNWGNFRNTNLNVTYGQSVYSTHVTYFGEDSTDGVLWSSRIVNGVYLDINAVTFNTDPTTNTPIDIEIEDEGRTLNDGHYRMHSSAVLKWGDRTAHDNYAVVFAPIEYAAPTKVQDSAISLLYAVPVFVILSISLAFVVLFRRN